MEFTLDEAEKDYLVSVARESILSFLDGRPARYGPLPASGKDKARALESACGAFVTLHKGHALRGCIGRMSATAPLLETIKSMARSAAFEDPRFPPLAKEEFAACVLEISVLSPMQACEHHGDVIVGTHGVYLTHRGRSGVFLPQVPVEQGWNREEYLEQLCHKAGLPPHSYREADAQLYIFTALVFGEPKEKG